MPAKLSVNLNAVALLRNRRDLPWPSVAGIGRLALEAGAHGLTVHPRPDERHTRQCRSAGTAGPDRRRVPRRRVQHRGLSQRGFPAPRRGQPAGPGDAGAGRSVAGDLRSWLGLRSRSALLEPIVARLKQRPLPRLAVCRRRSRRGGGRRRRSAPTGSSSTPARTGPAMTIPELAAEALQRLGAAAEAARAAGLAVNAGHDLTVANLPPLVARIPLLAEVSIGHGMTADALGISACRRRSGASSPPPAGRLRRMSACHLPQRNHCFCVATGLSHPASSGWSQF